MTLNDKDIIKEQMKAIGELQDRIKIQNFEIAKLRVEKRDLKEALRRRTKKYK